MEWSAYCYILFFKGELVDLLWVVTTIGKKKNRLGGLVRLGPIARVVMATTLVTNGDES